MPDKNYYVYIMTNFANTTFYIGVTSNLIKRIYEHENKIIRGFTSKYNLKKLVYFEETSDVNSALTREKQLKNWHRDWKINLIKSKNTNFADLHSTLITDPETSSGWQINKNCHPELVSGSEFNRCRNQFGMTKNINYLYYYASR